jgi:hypothetical protein
VVLGAIVGAVIGAAVFGALALRLARRADRPASVVIVRLRERLRSFRLRRRVVRVADAVAAHEPLPSHPPENIDRAAVRHAEQQRRDAARRARVQEEQERLRHEAQERAKAEWEARVAATRERAAALARTNAEAIERARRLRFERAEALAAARREAEERRLREVREAEERRRREVSERTQRRVMELADRRRLGRETESAMKEAFVADDLHRQRETELSRAQVVQLRSEEARELARSWVVNPRTGKAEPPPPIPGEHRAVEVLMVDLPRPGEEPPPVPAPAPARAAARVPAPSPAPAPIVDVTDAPRQPARRKKKTTRRTDERVAVHALDIEALNEFLQRD